MVKRRRTWRPRYHRVKRLKRRKKIGQITDITQGNIKKNFTIKNLRFLHFLRRKLGFRSGILLTISRGFTFKISMFPTCCNLFACNFPFNTTAFIVSCSCLGWSNIISSTSFEEKKWHSKHENH